MSTDDRDAEQPFATTVPGGTATATQDTIVPTVSGSGILDLPAAGYDIGEVIGRGGMGEVVTARDRRIGRDVAIKRMRAEAPSGASVTRFLREAQIQAHLDHPAIVPVHEINIDSENRPYFTMKRLAGETLAQRLASGAPLASLVRAFADVCLAIEFAHSRGVVHRDLKPANIMLGDYGEVYVLDWGIARRLDKKRRATTEPRAEGDTLDEGTQTGELLGTPGYMAPEQVCGVPVTTATDVYALGAICFEILSGQSLHPHGTAALASTLTSPCQTPSSRAPERQIPPELDAACVAALAEDPAARPSARELADRIQRYLDGDRDVERRRQLAAEELALARVAFDSGDPEARSVAMHHAGRALGLDPASVDAASLISRLMVEPPRVLPSALVADLAEDERQVSTQRLRTAVLSLLSVCALVLLLPWMTIRNWTTLGISLGVLLAVIALLWRSYRLGRPNPYVNLIAGIAIGVAFTRVVGPFVLTPIVITGSLLAITANPWLHQRPFVVVVWLLVVLALPHLCEAVGLFASTWSLTDGGLISSSAIVKGRDSVDAFVLLAANGLLLMSVAHYGIKSGRSASEAQRNVRIQAWHLGQLLPSPRRSRP
jgi:serine/threonine-protein kinase